MESFSQKTSLIKRLSAIVWLVAAFFVLEIFTFYSSSQTYLKGLTQVSQANSLYALTTQIAESLESSSENLRKLGTYSEPAELAVLFHAIQDQAKADISRAREMSAFDPELQKTFNEIENAFAEIDRAGDTVLEDDRPGRAPQFARDLLIYSQFELEAKETLRRAQIQLMAKSEKSFSRVYGERFIPLVFSVIVCILLCAIVLIGGRFISLRLARSIDNLMRATEIVASGDLKHQAPVLGDDEIARLTFEFNRMVTQLEDSQGRLSFISNTSALLAGTMDLQQTLDGAAQVAVEHFCEFCTVNVFQSEGSLRNISAIHARSEQLAKQLADPAVAEIFSDPKPGLVTEVTKAFLDRVSRSPEHRSQLEKLDIGSFINVPVVARRRVLGIITFVRSHLFRKFSPDDLAAAEEAGRRLGLAVENVLLFQAEQRSRKSAQAAVKIRDEFLSIASHELKTPVTSLKLQLDVTRKQIDSKSGVIPTPLRLETAMRNSSRQVDRLSALIEELLDISRIQAGKLGYFLEDVDLSQLLNEDIEIFGLQLSASGSSLESRVQPGITAHCDRSRTDQVFVNLISNAIKYGSGKPIQVSLTESDGSINFQVRDHGIGISKDKQKLVFERFERAIPSVNISGLGLGLYIAKSIVEAQNGTIRLQSEPGEGSTFTVTLPKRVRLVEEPREAAAGPTAQEG